LYDAGNIAWHYQGDKKSAEKSFRKLIKQYPDDPLSISAQSTLGEWSGNCPPRSLASDPDPIGADSRMGNYPNPFNPSTVLRYSIPEGGFVSLKVFDVLAREVATLVNEYQAAGNHEVRFDASHLSSGMYLYRLGSAGKAIVQKMLLVR
jgi:hypothetical protein